MSGVSRLITLGTFSILVACSSSREPHPLLNQPLPDSRFTLLDGSYHSTHELEGKKCVIVFWAQWCSFSRPVLEKLDVLAERYRDRDDVRFIAVSIDDFKNYELLSERIAHTKINTLDHAFSGNGLDDEMFITFKAGNLPHVFLINEKGVVVKESHDVSGIEEFLG